jgi:hypothetical protein
LRGLFQNASIFHNDTLEEIVYAICSTYDKIQDLINSVFWYKLGKDCNLAGDTKPRRNGGVDICVKILLFYC